MNREYLNFLYGKIEDSVYAFFNANGEKAVFGMGRQARVMRDISLSLGEEIEFFLSTTKQEFADALMRKEVSYELDEFEGDAANCHVLVAVHPKWNSEIKEALLKKGFRHIYLADDWNKMNDTFRWTYYEYIMSKYGVNHSGDVIRCGKFSIGNVKRDFDDREYAESFLVEALDIIYPFLFQDVNACIEGPYEYMGAELPVDGIVIDAGANIGMFSCCATSKGCTAYAFEPTKRACDMLQRNVNLNPGIRVINKALGEKSGTASFVVNDFGEGTENRFGEIAKPGSHVEMVTVTTIDEFVKENNLQNVDFIKADIEGAERQMLLGA